MVRGRNLRAARVHQTAEQFVASHIINTKGRLQSPAPPWLSTVGAIPPAEILTRPYPVQHKGLDPRARKPHNLFRPTKIVYPEDQLRRDFYRDHPWELARPRLVLELDGKDARYRDWSKGLRQPGMPLSGECVVQRQLYLMENGNSETNGKRLSKERAYDIVRKEFYKLRHQEDVERRIAVEEARMVGGYFGKSDVQVGMELEDKEYESWKHWASIEIARLDAEKNQSHTSVADLPGDELDGEDNELAALVK
ncbi:mitochondrial ribosomal protein S25-domain-containing protein [Bombardia bombarda]|uniref:37S ribosomal protein S25, mitochondrial n=1 Tax=Bombardia bombarda TaxID=252184 RepID=A0AA40CEY4_9PEZI|nr:mitochondrial ribosomal protein S25-domain-containing protein [Bombardia bombarda]